MDERLLMQFLGKRLGPLGQRRCTRVGWVELSLLVLDRNELLCILPDVLDGRIWWAARRTRSEMPARAAGTGTA